MSSESKATRMQRWFPGTAHPLVVSAPMDFVTNSRLVSEVTNAKGFGFIQGGRTFTPDSPVLPKLEEALGTARKLLLAAEAEAEAEAIDGEGSARKTDEEIPVLPIGVGFVLYSACAEKHFAETTAPILARHRPAAVWFFAPDPERGATLRVVIEAIRRAAAATEGCWDPKIAVQVGTVHAAREAARLGADIVVAQGADAGGHQFARGAGVVSLVPEIKDMLRREFAEREGDVAVWSAGGLADGRGVAAMYALGAEGAVLGTRYMVATEADTQDWKRTAILTAEDGGLNTVKSQLHDHVQGNREWPDVYDGRAIVHPSYTDHEAGMHISENERMFKQAKEKGDTSRMPTWSGTGVGLVRSELPAGEITRAVREEAIEIMKGLGGGL